MEEKTPILTETATAWADIVLKIWQDKLTKLRINTTNSLINSLFFHVVTAANGDPSMISFFFNYYGRFVDMGVGKGVTISKIAFSNRRAKPWYSKAFYSQVLKLSEIYAQKYSQKAAFTIVNSIENKQVA